MFRPWEQTSHVGDNNQVNDCDVVNNYVENIVDAGGSDSSSNNCGTGSENIVNDIPGPSQSLDTSTEIKKTWWCSIKTIPEASSKCI